MTPQMPSLVPVLSCNELLRLIFQELQPVYLRQDLLDTATSAAVAASAVNRRKARRNLASAARVCRAFSEHTLDTLWEVLEGLVPLLGVLPSYHNPSSPLVR